MEGILFCEDRLDAILFWNGLLNGGYFILGR